MSVLTLLCNYVIMLLCKVEFLFAVMYKMNLNRYYQNNSAVSVHKAVLFMFAPSLCKCVKVECLFVVTYKMNLNHYI